MTLATTNIETPIGELTALADNDALLLLEFSDSKELQKKISIIAQEKGGTVIQKYMRSFSGTGSSHLTALMHDDDTHRILDETRLQLNEYFQGTRQSFTLPLAPTGTVFQMKAWKALEQIPYGTTRSYLEEATMIGKAKAVRAIGGANHANPIVIIIPCHRVIGKDGTLVGYGGGMERKIWLIDHERNTSTRLNHI